MTKPDDKETSKDEPPPCKFYGRAVPATFDCTKCKCAQRCYDEFDSKYTGEDTYIPSPVLVL